MVKNWLIVLMSLLSGCGGYPKNVTPVQSFEINRYLGKWYEIARLDHSFERDLDRVTAEYTLLDNGDLQVINRGFDRKTNQWKEAIGKAHFARKKNEGYLKVSFFGPFYSSYVIFNLDLAHYQYAYVTGPNHDYLWLLSRKPSVSNKIINDFVETAEKKGFQTEDLIYVTH